MEAPELLPCPFCGSAAMHERDEIAYIGNCHEIIVCIECGASGANVSTPKEAAAVWNRRADLVPQWQPIETAPVRERILVGDWDDGLWHTIELVIFDEDHIGGCNINSANHNPNLHEHFQWWRYPEPPGEKT